MNNCLPAPTAPSRLAHRLGLASVLLVLLAGPAAAEPSNAVVIDFDQRGLILGWLGLWLVAVLTFAACADKRIALMTRLANYLNRRAQRRAGERADAALRELARHDPRILADVLAAVDHARLHAPAIQPPLATTAVPAVAAAQPAPKAAAAGYHLSVRGFRTAPLPGLPRHLQYLPG